MARPVLRTELCDTLGIEYPVILAGMGPVAGGIDGPVATPPRPALTRDGVLAKAVELADHVGADALTMRKLADALDVKPMSLYHHVANKEAILDGMVDVVFSEIASPAPPPPRCDRFMLPRRPVRGRCP